MLQPDMVNETQRLDADLKSAISMAELLTLWERPSQNAIPKAWTNI